MRWFSPLLRMTALAWLALLAAAGLPYVLGAARSGPPLAAAWFTDAAGQPCADLCLFGVRPGQTSLYAASEALEAHPFTRTFEAHPRGAQIDYWATPFSLNVTLVPTLELGLSSIGVWVDPRDSASAGLTFGDLLAALGPPTHLQIATTGGEAAGYVSWYYLPQNLIAVSRFEQPRLRPDAPVDYLGLSAQPDTLDLRSPVAMSAIPFIKYNITAWLGFASFGRYINHDTCYVQSFSGGQPCPCSGARAGTTGCWLP